MSADAMDIQMTLEDPVPQTTQTANDSQEGQGSAKSESQNQDKDNPPSGDDTHPIIGRKRVRLEDDTGELSTRDLQAQILKLELRNKSLEMKCSQLRSMTEQPGPVASSSNETDNAHITSDNPEHAQSTLSEMEKAQTADDQRKITLANHEKDEAVKALCIAQDERRSVELQKDALEHTNALIQARVRELELENKTLMDGERITQLTNEVSAHKAMVIELQEKLHVAQESQKTNQEIEDNDLREKIAVLTDEKALLEHSLAEVRAAKATLELTVAENQERLEEAEVTQSTQFPANETLEASLSTLQQQKEDLDQQVLNLTTSCDNARQQIQDLESTLRAQMEEAKEIARQRSMEEVEFTILQEEYQTIDQELQTMTAESAQLQGELNKLRKEKDDESSLCYQLKSQLSDAAAKELDLTEEVSRIKRTVKEVEDNAISAQRSLEAECAQLRGELNELRKEKDNEFSLCSQLKTQLKDATAKELELTEEVSRIKRTAKEAENNAVSTQKSLESGITKLSAEKATLQAEYDTTKEKVKSLVQDKDNELLGLKQSYLGLEGDLQTVRSDLANAKSTLEAREKQYDLLRKDYDYSVAKANETEKQREQYQIEVAQLKGVLLAAQSKEKEAVDGLATFRASNLVLQGEKDESAKSLATLHTRHSELQTDYKKMEASVESLRAAQSKAQEEIQKNRAEHQKSLTAAEEKLRTLHDTIKSRNAEIQRLQSELKKPESSTSTPSRSLEIPTQLTTSEDYLGSHRQTLRTAPVNEELRRIAEADSAGRNPGKYRLGATIETAQFPWEHPNKPSPYTKSGARIRKARRNGYETDSEDSEGTMSDEQSSSESDSEDDRTEKDDHAIRKRWGGLERRKKWTAKEQGINAAGLVRAILLAFLGCKHLYEAFALPQIDDERLKSFREGDEVAKAKYGPKLRNSRLDKRGTTTTMMLESEWNQMVMFRLAEECTEIANRAKDSRFGKEKHDWHSMIRVRLQPILKTHLEAKPKFNGEPAELRIGRVAQRYRKIKMTSKGNNILYTKYHVRASIATIMIQAMREKDDQEGLAMWQYVLQCLHKLQHEGMSDEESGEDEVVVGGEKTRVRLRKVLVLVWRHPTFKELFALVDSTREAEASIFSQQGRPRLLRIRVEKNSTNSRTAPKHLPKSFFRPEWLAEMGKFPFKIDALKLSSRDFPLRVITNLPELEA